MQVLINLLNHVFISAFLEYSLLDIVSETNRIMTKKKLTSVIKMVRGLMRGEITANKKQLMLQYMTMLSEGLRRRTILTVCHSKYITSH